MSRRHATTVSHWSEPLAASCRLRGAQGTHRHAEQPVQFVVAHVAVVDDANRDERALDHVHRQVDVEFGVDLTPGHRPLKGEHRRSSRLNAGLSKQLTIGRVLDGTGHHPHEELAALLRPRHLEIGPVDLGEVAAQRPGVGRRQCRHVRLHRCEHQRIGAPEVAVQRGLGHAGAATSTEGDGTLDTAYEAAEALVASVQAEIEALRDDLHAAERERSAVVNPLVRRYLKTAIAFLLIWAAAATSLVRALSLRGRAIARLSVAP